MAYNLLQRRVRATNAKIDSLAHLVLSSLPPDRSSASRWQAQQGDMMAGKVASSYGDDEGGTISDINVTPLVDVTLVLLIVFMITVPAIVGSAQLKVDLPESIAADPTVAELPLRLAVRREPTGEIGLYLNDQRTDEASLKRLVADIVREAATPGAVGRRQKSGLWRSGEGDRSDDLARPAQSFVGDQARSRVTDGDPWCPHGCAATSGAKHLLFMTARMLSCRKPKNHRPCPASWICPWRWQPF